MAWTDQTLELFTDFVTATRPADVPDHVIEATTNVVLDTLACVMAGRDCPGAEVAAKIADLPRGPGGAVISRSTNVTIEMAAFWNSSMLRYADYNDSLTAGHPSDMIGALIAVAGAHKLPGRTLLSGTAVAYEVFHHLMLRHRSYRKDQGALVDNLSIDQGFFVCVGAAAGIAHMLGFNKDHARNAISLAATNGLPLRANRSGELSHYKGVATAVSARHAVFACKMAEQGLTGPDGPFEGRHGYIEIMEGKAGPINVKNLPEWAITRDNLKYFPATQNTQIGIWAAKKLRGEVDVTQIREILLHTSKFLWHESGSEPAKFAPTTHETADHSLPYTFSIALIDGTVSLASYEDEMLARQDLRDMMAKIKVQVDDQIEAEWPQVIQIRGTVTLADGTVHEVYERDPKGVHLNPMSRDDIQIKFRNLAGPFYGDQTDAIFMTAAALADSADINELLDRMLIE